MVNLNVIKFEYTLKDMSYIDELMGYVNSRFSEIISFFDMNDFDGQIIIKLFDDLECFRSKCMEKKNCEVPVWLCGLSFYENKKHNIYTLCLEEYRKTKGHSMCSLNDLKLLLVHELVHACHLKYTNNMKLPVWLSEGLAVTLSHQFNDYEDLEFNATLEQMIKGGVDYKNYYVMFSYVLNNYGREYILKLLKDKEFLEKQTSKLHEEVIKNYRQKMK